MFILMFILMMMMMIAHCFKHFICLNLSNPKNSKSNILFSLVFYR